ncbi:MAG: class E sortase [Actinobacteria bacterium]|nr:class E sortase [Actinomycetota bacterium]
MLAKILGGTGRTLMTAGTLILLFVAYQLWGTGLQEAKSQAKLGDQFDQTLAEVAASTTTSTTTSTSTTVPGQTTPLRVVPAAEAPALPLPEIGDPVAKIEIPRIGITRTVVEGITIPQLARGPGHYPSSPLPGQKGNVAIAGHRTTYGQPFHNIDKLQPGDQILTTTVQGEFVYEVTGLEIVKPDAVEILEDQGDNRMTLIACHPKYSLKERIIAHAKLVGVPAPEIEGQAEARTAAVEAGSSDPFATPEASGSLDGGLSGAAVSKTPAILWGVVCALVWLITWLVQVILRRRVRAASDGRPSRPQRLLTWTPYLLGVPVFLVTLYVFFENFARLLPGNY